MKKLAMIFLFFLAACNAQVAVDEPTAQPIQEDPAPQEALMPETAVPVDEAYPAIPTSPPLSTGGYPPAPSMPDPYPAAGEGGLIWVIRPEGVQCEASDAPTGEKGLQEAVESLAAAGVTAQAWELTEMMVTAVCGSPTSTHYLVQIPAANLDKAIALGWTAQ